MLSYYLFKSLSFIFCLMPRYMTLFIGRIIGFLLKRLIRKREKVCIKNMDLILQDNPDEDYKRSLIDSSCTNLGYAFTDWMRLPLYKKKFPDWINFSGEEKLKNVMKRKRGTIILTAHIGYWEFLFLSATKLGYKCYGVAKKMRPEGLNKFALEYRSTDLVTIITKKNSASLIREKLKEGAIVGFIMDQNMNDSLGIPVAFGKEKAGTLTAPALLAARYNVPVISCFVIRNKDNSITFQVGDEILPAEKGSLREKIEVNTQRYSDEVLRVVRKYPEQWIWMHRRFKHTCPEIYR